MNRNLKGELFSRDELIEMAVSIGAFEAEKVTRDVKTHVFLDATREHRLALFMRGEAILDTRPDAPTTPKSCEVDREVLAFLGVVL